MFQIINWSSHQSYKDRRPPWIRFHKTLLDNYEFQSMSVNTRAILPMLWLLASEHEDPTSGIVEQSYKSIAFRLRVSEKDIKSAVEEAELSGFISMLQIRNETVTELYSNRNPRDREETEAEANTEAETTSVPEWLPEKEWSVYCKQRGRKFTDNAKGLAIKKLGKWRDQGHDPIEIINESIMNGWQGLFEPKGNKNVNSTDKSKLTGHAALGEIHRRASNQIEQDRLQGKVARTALDDYDFGENVSKGLGSYNGD